MKRGFPTSTSGVGSREDSVTPYTLKVQVSSKVFSLKNTLLAGEFLRQGSY